MLYIDVQTPFFFNCLISANVYDEYTAWKHSLSPLKSYHSFKYLVLKKMCLPSPDIHQLHHNSGSADLHLVCCSFCRTYTFCLASLIYSLLHFPSSHGSTFEFWVLQFGFQIFFTHFPYMFFSKYLSLPALGPLSKLLWHLLSFTVTNDFVWLLAWKLHTAWMHTHKNKAVIEKCQRKNASQVIELHLKSRYQQRS